MKFWIFPHKESNRYIYSHNDNKNVISDRIVTRRSGTKSNICPYIWSNKFFASNCKQNKLKKMCKGDIIFYVIPEPRPESEISNEDYEITYLYCDLVFEVGDTKDIKSINEIDLKEETEDIVKNDNDLYEYHFKAGFVDHPNSNGSRKLLISTENTSFQPQEKNKLIDLLKLNLSSDIKEKLKVSIRTGKCTNLNIFQISENFGKKILKELTKKEKIFPYEDFDMKRNSLEMVKKAEAKFK